MDKFATARPLCFCHPVGRHGLAGAEVLAVGFVEIEPELVAEHRVERLAGRGVELVGVRLAAHVEQDLAAVDRIDEAVGELGLVVGAHEVGGGDLDRVGHCVRLGGFVNCAPDFDSVPFVVNGASDLMAEVFGDFGEHARTAVGVASLPRRAAVEVEAIFRRLS